MNKSNFPLTCGAFDNLLKPFEDSPVERYRLWILLSQFHDGEALAHKLVMELALPFELEFTALGEVL